jgi:hypothetical protein
MQLAFENVAGNINLEAPPPIGGKIGLVVAR